MQPIFTIHAGEYLVGSKIEEEFGKEINVWVPSKDTGIDLLLTDKKTNKKTVSIQVKFSKDFLSPSKQTQIDRNLLACGWWTLNQHKLKNSPADFWIFVIHSYKTNAIKDTEEIDKPLSKFVIISKDKLINLFNSLGRLGENNSLPCYIWITHDNMCWETRNLKQKEWTKMIENKDYENDRNITKYLENWDDLKEMLGLIK